MSIALIRVDERLIHGQVVIGWGSGLRPDRYVVVDDALAESEWEQDLYALGVPGEVELDFLSADRARGRLQTWRDSPGGIVILLRDLQTALALAQNGALEGESINLGGLHARQGREEVLSYLFLDSREREVLQALAEAGARISAQDLPGSPKIPLASLLD